MARPRSRTLIATLLAVVTALALTACGGGGGGEDMTEGLTPAELLQRSSAEAAKLESFRIAFDGNGTIDLAEGASVAGASLLDGPLTVSGEGPVQPPDKASIDAKIELAAFSPQVNITRVGDEVFVGVLGQDFKIDVPPAQVGLFDFGELFPALAGWISDPAEAGREEIDGTPTVKVTGDIDAEKAFADLAPLLGASGTTPADAAAFAAALEQGTVETWIGTEDLRPRRVHVVLKAGSLPASVPVRAIDLDLTADLSAFDEPVDIVAPRDARTLDPTQLGSLTGG